MKTFGKVDAMRSSQTIAIRRYYRLRLCFGHRKIRRRRTALWNSCVPPPRKKYLPKTVFRASINELAGVNPDREACLSGINHPDVGGYTDCALGRILSPAMEIPG